MRTDKRKISPQIQKEIAFLESLSRRCPEDTEIMKALGDLYTKIGRHQDGLTLDRRLVQLCPTEPMVWYNLACSYALVGSKDEAITSLEKSVSLGYSDCQWISEDQDLVSLKNDHRFQALLQRLTAHSS